MERNLLTYQEISKLLNIKIATLYSLVSRRRIPHIRLSGKMVRFDQEQIERWLDARRRAEEEFKQVVQVKNSEHEDGGTK